MPAGGLSRKITILGWNDTIFRAKIQSLWRKNVDVKGLKEIPDGQSAVC